MSEKFPPIIPPLPPTHRKGGIANLFSSNLIFSSLTKHRHDGAANFLSFYENNSGTLQTLLNNLFIDLTEQRAWLSIWLRFDPNRKNRLTFHEFCNLFQFDSNYEWSRRIFDIINNKLTGVITFDEYLTFCYKYLILNIQTLKEFTFCLLSRRAATCDIHTTILDLQDMKTFLKFCYKIKKQNLDKVAMEIFTEMDNSGDFGIAFTEFDIYSQRNQIFLLFGNYFLTHFRLCWFGYDYWVQKSRKIKKSQLVGFGSFIRLKNANLEAEEFIKGLMKRRGINPNNLQKIKNKSSRGDGMKEETTTSVPVVSTVSTKRRGSVLDRLSILTKKKEEPKLGIGPGGVMSEEYYDEDDVQGDGGEETDEQKAHRLNSLQFFERKFDYHRYGNLFMILLLFSLLIVSPPSPLTRILLML